MKQLFTLETSKNSSSIINTIKGAALSSFFFLLIGCTQLNEWEVVEKYKNGNPKVAILYYDNGSRDSTFLLRKFYENGAIKSYFDYKNGKLEGKAVGFYENGCAGLLVNYNRGLRHGLEVKWTDAGILRSKFNFHNDKIMNGSYFFENGQRTADLTFDSLGRVMKGIYYHPNGNKRSEGAFHSENENLKEGRWKVYYENGVLKETGIYQLGERKGEWIFYDSLGNEEMIARYSYP